MKDKNKPIRCEIFDVKLAVLQPEEVVSFSIFSDDSIHLYMVDEM